MRSLLLSKTPQLQAVLGPVMTHYTKATLYDASMTDAMTRLAELCWEEDRTSPVYDREAVGVEEDDRAFSMFCLAQGIKETGRGCTREEAQQEAASKVLVRLEKEGRSYRREEPVSFLEKIAQDRSYQVSYKDFHDEGVGQFGCLAQLSCGPQVGVCYGAGSDKAVAREQAARGAINYLRIMSK